MYVSDSERIHFHVFFVPQWTNRGHETFQPKHGLFHVAELGISAADDKDAPGAALNVNKSCEYVYAYMHLSRVNYVYTSHHICMHVANA